MEIVSAQNGSAWPNSLAVQFFTSMRRHCADSAQVRSLEDLAATIANSAEQSAQKPLDREFIETAARSLSVLYATSTIRKIVCECAVVCESPIELATLFALGVVGMKNFETVLFDLPREWSGMRMVKLFCELSRKLRLSNTEWISCEPRSLIGTDRQE